MKRYIKSATAQDNYDRITRTKVDRRDVVDYMCKLLLSAMDEDPDMTFSEALKVLEQDMNHMVQELVPRRLNELAIWEDDEFTLEEALF